MRLARSLAVLLASFALLAPIARAEGPAPAEKPLPPLASTTDAKAALAKFKEEFKTKDPAAKADAVDGLGKTNHPLVVTELLKLTRNKDLEIRSAAFMNLGDQRAIPGVVGPELVKMLDAKSTDWEFLVAVIDTIEAVGYRGAWQPLVGLLHHENQLVVRWALSALGDTKDVRALDAIVALVKELKIETGVSWDGVEVSVDTGSEGSADQDAAEALGRAMLAANKGKGRSGAKRLRSMGTIVYDVLKEMTGQKFKSGEEVRTWVAANKTDIDAKKKALDAETKAQEEGAKAAVAQSKAGK